ncbi:MAG: UDP-N-acetylmuramate--L-alanine ligase [Planctomycetales bacterium]
MSSRPLPLEALSGAEVLRTGNISAARLPTPFNQPGRAHLTGICGAGMKALAELLIDAGWQVSGSDLDAEAVGASTPLQRLGVDLHAGHQSAWVSPEAKLLIYSAAIPALNPERLRAAELGLAQFSYSEALGELTRSGESIVIAGTHGKTTTTAWTAHLLNTAELNPTAVIGGELCDPSQRNGWLGTGSSFVVEGCEYRRNFLKLRPHSAAVLGVEPDHFDYFSSFEDTVSAFREFLSRVPQSGFALLHHSRADELRSALVTGVDVETFGLDVSATWTARNIRRENGWTTFSVEYQGSHFFTGRIRLPGEQNVANALAAGILAYRAGAQPHQILQGWASFTGVRRRFEILRKSHGVTWVDDYAHHPTAVRLTLQTARAEFPSGRLFCIFQPHQVSRTETLIEDFARSLSAADRTVIVPVFGARESDSQSRVKTARRLCDKVNKYGGKASFRDSLDLILPTLEDEFRPGDVVLTIGAGDIHRIHHVSHSRFSRDHSPG